MRRALILTVSGLALWALLIGPALWLCGAQAWIESVVALTLCLVPAVVTMLLAEAAWSKSPDLQVLAALGGSGVRMALVLGLGAILYYRFPETYTPVFWGWLLIFYLVLLAVEVMFLLRPSGASGDGPNAGPI